MILRPFSYYGAKHAIANQYPVPEHSIIIEPFAGSAGYSCFHSCRQVKLYDLDPTIAGAWNCLINSNPQALRELSLNIDDIKDKDARNLVGYWLANGRTAPVTKASSWAKSGQRPNAYWGPVAREIVANISILIKHWAIERKSYDEIAVDNEDITWFIDPPYSSKAGRSYTYNIINYEKLAEWCKNLSGQVIVCEEEGATWLPFRPLTEYKNSSKTKKTREVIWTN